MWTSGIGKISLFITLVAFVLGYGEFAAHPHATASVHGAVERGMPGTQDIDNIPIYTPHNSHESRDRINNYGGDASENLGNIGDHLDTVEADADDFEHAEAEHNDIIAQRIAKMKNLGKVKMITPEIRNIAKMMNLVPV